MDRAQSNTSNHGGQPQSEEQALPLNPCQQRTQALVDSGYSQEWQVAFTAADYIYALENPVYAESLGGLDNALAELKHLVNQWQNSFDGVDGTDINP